MSRTTRPALLAVGVVLSSLRALIMLGVLGLIGTAGLVMMLASTGERGDEAVGLLIAGACVVLVTCCLAAFHLVILCACVGAWLRWRAGVWALLALSALGLLLPPGPFRTPIAIVTIIGCILALERDESD